MGEYYNFEGEPITLGEWAELQQGNRHIAFTDLGDVHVSTVWIGLDHSFGGTVPIIFETLVFGGVCDGEMERYPNRHAALAGHDRMVARVRECANADRSV